MNGVAGTIETMCDELIFKLNNVSISVIIFPNIIKNFCEVVFKRDMQVIKYSRNNYIEIKMSL